MSRAAACHPRARPLVLDRVRLSGRDASSAELCAVALEDGTVAGVGSVGEMRGVLGPGVETLDLDGARLVPAFRDAHVHLAAGSLEIGRLDLRGSSSEDDLLRAVAAHAASLPSGAWVRGFGWSGEHGLSPAALDRAASGRPVALARSDGHALRLGAAAMRILGIDGGDGLLVERAADEARARIPADGEAERRAAVEAGLALAARHGLASVDDVVEPWALPRYLVRREGGTLSCRVRAWLPIEMDRGEAERWRAACPPGDPWLEAATLKVFLDGTMGARSAALFEPYADDPGSSGSLRWGAVELFDRVAEAVASGWSVAFHAVGDRAVAQALDVLEALPPRSSGGRHRIEHAQLVAEADLKRIVAVGAVVGIQPGQWLDDRRWIAARLGERGGCAHPWRALADAGVPVEIGSDWPVGPIDPAATFRAARERGEETLTAEEVSRAYRGRPAGERVAVGDPADLVALAESGEGFVVRATVVGGAVTFDAAGSSV